MVDSDLSRRGIFWLKIIISQMTMMITIITVCRFLRISTSRRVLSEVFSEIAGRVARWCLVGSWMHVARVRIGRMVVVRFVSAMKVARVAVLMDTSLRVMSWLSTSEICGSKRTAKAGEMVWRMVASRSAYMVMVVVVRGRAATGIKQ